MNYLPVFLDLRGRPAVVVGGGAVAARKAELVARSGASVRIVSRDLSPAMRSAIDRYGFTLAERGFEDSDVNDAHLVVAATNDADVNCRVYEAASLRRVPVNVVDSPELCTFIMPAIVDRSPVIVAVSSGGRSPVLSRFVRSLIERTLPARLGRLADLLGAFRRQVALAIREPLQRRRFWERLLDSRVPDLVFAGRDAEARKSLDALLGSQSAAGDRRGAVYLVGAGPGDPELLTIKAQRLLQRADVVVYDRLVPVGVLEMCRREAETIYVGKRRGDHPVAQEDICRLLVDLAMKGKRVARLKGGDPFLFGRGGEELAELVAAGIDFEVVPGISAANGTACYAGIPLTHRDHAQSVSFWTGHTRNGDADLDWSAMLSPGQTLVFFMGRMHAGRIASELTARGMPATTPAALVQAATTPRQRVTRTSLARLAAAASDTDASLPLLIIVGSVVNLRRDLEWFAGGNDDAVPVYPPHLSRDGSSIEHGAA